MFEEGQYFAPWWRRAGTLQVQLGTGHPGFSDPLYRRRRDALVTPTAAWRPGQPAPVAPYADTEHEVWPAVCGSLEAKHGRYACAESVDGKHRLGLPWDTCDDDAIAAPRAAA